MDDSFSSSDEGEEEDFSDYEEVVPVKVAHPSHSNGGKMYKSNGAMLDHTPERMELAFGYLKMNARGFFLKSKLGSELLLAAARDEGLKARPIPPDDHGILRVSRIYEDLSMRFGGRRNSNF
ncbi:hypothetical protein IEQ34_012913 [Dendrobium chrysotoxum]|uniref:Uncharacterized protein n=1 Tax=Dendrobium chrysotoxum TaxID=161865 RepID=A0AAV7GPJ1_DENCH|nr:hypothetical protein IEQ34_012913 [Dendrobium chrysotoxum]